MKDLWREKQHNLRNLEKNIQKIENNSLEPSRRFSARFFPLRFLIRFISMDNLLWSEPARIPIRGRHSRNDIDVRRDRFDVSVRLIIDNQGNNLELLLYFLPRQHSLWMFSASNNKGGTCPICHKLYRDRRVRLSLTDYIVQQLSHTRYLASPLRATVMFPTTLLAPLRISYLIFSNKSACIDCTWLSISSPMTHEESQKAHFSSCLQFQRYHTDANRHCLPCQKHLG